jgi:ABC-2 type transport system ATP-binding protein
MIEIQNLNFGFKGKILDDINLTVQNEGQVIALFGPNGAGKTTILNVLANYYQKKTGTIETDNKFFFLPDEPYLPEDWTITKCLASFNQLYDTFNEARARKMLDSLKLDFNKEIAEYSKGMKEQLHTVLALAQDVDTYLFDEPLAGVDPLTRERLLSFIMHDRKPGSTIIISTHLISDVSDIFDEVMFLDEGKIILHDSVNRLLDEYNDTLENVYKKVMLHASSFSANR